MIEQQKRLIEAERRIARLESTLHRTNVAITSVQGAIRNDSYNVPNPFGTGGGGTAEINRFPTAFEMWVEWDTVPTLKTGASSNVPADGPALADAVSALEVGLELDSGNLNDTDHLHFYDTSSSMVALFYLGDYRDTHNYGGVSSDFEFYFRATWYQDGDFVADTVVPAGYEGALTAESTATQVTRIEIDWPRRNGIGTVIGSDRIIARRTLASEDNFTYGPTYGTTGTWSFAMECPATTYHNAGSGTIYLRWGTATESIVGGGTSGSLPADAYDGGSADSLPADIIDGGTF